MEVTGLSRSSFPGAESCAKVMEAGPFILMNTGGLDFSSHRSWVRVGHGLAFELGKCLIVTAVSRRVRM